MLITKVIEVGIDVQNAINIYTDDNNIKHIISDRYEGKCFRGCWIKTINKILRVGECQINQDGTPSFGTIPVIFEATAIAYAVGEVINGCVVQNKDKNGIIICNTDISSIVMNAHKSLESITRGQIISVRVGAARYNPGASKVSISAIPFTFQEKPVVYKVGPVTEKEREFLSAVYERIAFEESEVVKLKKDKAKAWETFDQLLYAYKEEQSTPTSARVINILDLVKKPLPPDIKYISRDNRLNLSTPQAYAYSSPQFPPGAILRSELPTANVLLILLEDYCSHLRTIREMINIYTTEEILTSHRNLWQIFRKNKL